LTEAYRGRHAVEAYWNTKDAYEAFGDGSGVACVVSDNACPDRNDGYRMLMMIKRSHTKVGAVLMTGGDSDTTQQNIDTLKAVGIGFRRKPFEDIDDLVAIVDEKIREYESKKP